VSESTRSTRCAALSQSSRISRHIPPNHIICFDRGRAQARCAEWRSGALRKSVDCRSDPSQSSPSNGALNATRVPLRPFPSASPAPLNHMSLRFWMLLSALRRRWTAPWWRSSEGARSGVYLTMSLDIVRNIKRTRKRETRLLRITSDGGPLNIAPIEPGSRDRPTTLDQTRSKCRTLKRSSRLRQSL